MFADKFSFQMNIEIPRPSPRMGEFSVSLWAMKFLIVIFTKNRFLNNVYICFDWMYKTEIENT